VVQDFFHQQYTLKNDDWKRILSLTVTLQNFGFGRYYTAENKNDYGKTTI